LQFWWASRTRGRLATAANLLEFLYFSIGYPKILAGLLVGKAADYDKNSSVGGRPDIARAPTLRIQKANRIVRDPESAQAPRSPATARTEELSSAWNVSV
jgi:hypothetical protein